MSPRHECSWSYPRKRFRWDFELLKGSYWRLMKRIWTNLDATRWCQGASSIFEIRRDILVGSRNAYGWWHPDQADRLNRKIEVSTHQHQELSEVEWLLLFGPGRDHSSFVPIAIMYEEQSPGTFFSGNEVEIASPSPHSGGISKFPSSSHLRRLSIAPRYSLKRRRSVENVVSRST